MIFCLNPDCSHPRNTEDATHCLNCGSRLKLRGRYRPTKPLAQGGFGRTYIAVDEDRLNTLCVIKQLLPQDTGSQATEGSYSKTIELFYQEATQLSRLGEHAQIPTLFAFFEEEGRLYLVQEYIDGQTLWHEMEQAGRFSEAKVRQVLVQLLPVLRFVHDNHVVHRDITPVNILRRTRDNKLMLIDFGVSKPFTQTALVEPGTKVGTVGYAPLEQLRSGQAYPASDIYSLGVTCIQLLTQARPEVLFDPLHGWRWRQYLASKHLSISNRLGAILDKMIEERLSDRYQSVEAIVQDIKNPTSGKVGRRRTATKTSAKASTKATGQMAKNAKKTGKRVSTKNYASASPRTDALPETEIEAPTSSNSRKSMPPPPPFRAMAQSSSLKSLAPISHAPPLPQSRGWHCAYTLPAPSSLVTCVAIHELERNRTPLSGNAVSPLIPWVVGGCLDNTVLVWNLQTGRLQYTLDRHRRPVNAVAISPDGKVLASASDDATVKLWNLETGQLLESLSGHLRGVTSLAFAPDNSFAVSGSKDRTIQIWHPRQPTATGTLTARSGSIKTIALSPDGRWLASGGLDNKIHWWNLRERQLVHTLSGHISSVLSVAISPDGKQLASGSKDRTLKLWDIESGQEICTLASHLWDVNAVAFSPDGQSLVSGSSDKTLKVWDLKERRVLHTLSGHLGAVQGIAVSRDAKAIVSGGWDKSIKVWHWHD